VIVGAKTVEQLNDNLAAADIKLSVEELATLDKASAFKTEYPQWMVERHHAGRIPA
jgi:aryl-alcohol dehydrogenase-like predicted oxidoreductase